MKLIPEPTNICAKVRLCETVTVTPGSECILKGYIDGSYEASSVCLHICAVTYMTEISLHVT